MNERSVSNVKEGWFMPCKKGPTDATSTIIEIDDGAVFCKSNSEIESLLQELHTHLRTGNRKCQAEIDRYLIACIGPQFQHLVMSRGKAPHYDNLPDFSFYALSIIDASKDHIQELHQIFLLLRQCTPLRRRTKRAQRELQWEQISLQGIHHLVRSMQGTLMGLYPSCARTVAFITRVHVYRFIRSLLVSDFSTLNLYLQRIRYIVKICVMEHLCNTMLDFNPGICYMLNKSGQQLRHFCNAVTTMCDIFRGDLNSTFAKRQCIVATMLSLEKSAHSFFERCTRAYRGIISSNSPGFSSLEIFRKKNHVQSHQFIHLLPEIYSVKNQYIFELIHRDRVPKDCLESFWHLTQCITVHSLPVVVRKRQYEALYRRYPQASSRFKSYLFIQYVIVFMAGFHLYRSLQTDLRLRLLRHKAKHHRLSFMLKAQCFKL